MNWEERMRKIKCELMDLWDEIVDVYNEMNEYIDELENERRREND